MTSPVPMPILATGTPPTTMQLPTFGSFTPNRLDVDMTCPLPFPATGYPDMRTVLPIPVPGFPHIAGARVWNGLVSHVGWRRATGDGDTPADVGFGECMTE